MSSVPKAFEKLLNDYFNQFFTSHPADATYVGFTSGEGQFNTATLPALRRQHRLRQAALAKLDTIAPSALSNEQNLDRLAFRARLLRECEDFERGRHTHSTRMGLTRYLIFSCAKYNAARRNPSEPQKTSAAFFRKRRVISHRLPS